MDYLNTIIQIFGYISAAGAAAGVIVSAIKTLRKPCDNNSQKIEEHEEAIKELQSNATKDYDAISEIRDMNAALCQALIAIIDHEITGNHVDGLKKTKTDLIKQLTEHCK